MSLTFETKDGKTVRDGQKTTLTLRKGDYAEVHEEAGLGVAGEPVKIEATGTVRAFEHIERVYDEEGIAVGETSETRWEISTDDPQHPAIGFLPENALTRSGK